MIGSFDVGIQTDYTIHEFPAFSYILGDLHPHVMSVPFVVMFLGFLWNFWRAPIGVVVERLASVPLSVCDSPFCLAV